VCHIIILKGSIWSDLIAVQEVLRMRTLVMNIVFTNPHRWYSHSILLQPGL